MVANWPTWPGDPSRIRTGDLDLIAWFLAYTPYAIIHHHNIFFTTWLNYPHGVNLAQNPTSPLLGLLVAPLTLLVNPIASLNLLLWLAVPLSAASMFFVLRRFVRWDLAAFVGGALYGFSPYAVAQGADHLNLSFVPLPPLILFAMYEALRLDSKHRLRWGVALGVLVVAQFFVSSEIAVTSLLIGGVGAGVLCLSRSTQVGPTLRRGWPALLAAATIILGGVAYPLWAVLAGPYRYHGPAFPGGVNADLLGTVVPTSLQHFTLGAVTAEGSKLLSGNLTENGSYLGVPLLLLLTVIVVLCRTRPWVRFAALMMVITTVLSFGPKLVVGNHVTAIPLPWDLLQHLPFANNVIAVRLGLYTSLFAGLLVALGMDELRVRWRRAPQVDRGMAASERSFPVRRIVGGTAIATLATTSVLSLVPAWPLPTAPAQVPSYFSSAAVQRIPAGSVVLISPYPSVWNVPPQLWQAVADMRFRIIGGYGLFADRAGTDSPWPQVLQPEAVQRYLWVGGIGVAPYPPGPLPKSGSHLTCQFERFVANYHVGTVISMTSAADAQALNALFAGALGRPSTSGTSMDVWYGVETLVQGHPQCH